MKNVLYLLFLSFALPSLRAERSLYVDNFADILNSAAERTQLLEYAAANEIESLILYELHLVHNQHDLTDASSNQILADFLADAKLNYGITTVAAAGENAWFFEQRIIAYNATRTAAAEKFDVLGMEFEFWTPLFTDPGGYYCVNYLTPNGHNCDNAGAFDFCLNELTTMRTLADNSSHPMTTEMYVGWPDAAQLLQIADVVDRTLIHAYVSDPADAFTYALTRLEDYNGYSGVAPISIIFSAEPNFSGPWLTNNNMTAAETVFADDYAAAPGSWKSQVDLQGFTYFTYTMMSDIVLPLAEEAPAEVDYPLSSSNKLSITPNPAGHEIFLRTKRRLRPFRIYDTTGRVVLTGDFLPEYIDVSDFAAGLYFFRTAGEVLQFVKK